MVALLRAIEEEYVALYLEVYIRYKSISERL